MLEPKNKTTLVPFVAAYQETGTQANKISNPKARKSKTVNSNQAAREVLIRLMTRVKRI